MAKLPGRERKKQRAVILTAIRTETEAVRAHLATCGDEKYGGTIYQRGSFSAENCLWDVIVVQTGMGGKAAAIETVKAIIHFKPAIILFVGVAGGRKDVRYGDVVVPTKVYDYETGKDGEEFRTRPDVTNPSFILEQQARAEAMKTDWLKRLDTDVPSPPPKVHLGPLAAGECVVTSLHSVTEKRIQASFEDALAVDMESHGFFEAVRRTHPPVAALVIRGISDQIHDKAKIDNNKSQKIAARHASAFAFALLARVDTIDLSQGQDTPPIISESATLKDTSSEVALEADISSVSKDALLSLSIQECCEKIEEQIHTLFDDGLTIHRDQCKHAIALLKNIAVSLEHDQGLPSSFLQGLQMNTIHQQIAKLRSELHIFSQISSEGGQKYHNLHRSIDTKFDDLLRNLRQL